VGIGGCGGGGCGGHYSSGGPTSGTVNTGGGGGGTYYTFNYGGGGSGVVVIRYLNSYANAVSTTGSPTYCNDGTYKIYRWTGSGSVTF
jgi:hypothetical protein